MQSVRKKLHSRAGVSMLIALLFFLICLTVGSLILTAATASASKARGRYEDQQNYLAVASAARLLQENLGRHTYTTGRDLHTSTSLDEEGNPITTSYWVEITPFITPADANNGDLLTDAFVLSLPEVNSSFEVEAGEGMPKVDANFHMKSGGNTVITLSGDGYTLQVSFTCRTAQVSGYGYERSITSWSEGVITKGKGTGS